MTTRSSSLPSKRDTPAYPLAEAARYVRVAPTTLRTWCLGRSYSTRGGARHSPPLIQIADKGRMLLSFSNLVESHVLLALRTQHVVPIKHLRAALKFAERELKIDRLLLSADLSTSAGDLFLDRYGQLINLTRSGQLAMRTMLEAYLKRVERDESMLPIRLFPFVGLENSDQMPRIAIDPRLAFGRPVVLSRGISTAIIAERIDAGETPKDVAEDYGIGETEVQEAVVYERAA